MAKREEVTIEIDASGKINSDVISGPGGKGCLSMLDELLDGIGVKQTEGHKSEMRVATLPARQNIKR